MRLLHLSASASDPAAPARRTLLIVDDEEGPRQSLRVVFKDAYNILLADSGAAAIELAKNNRIDAAVLDIRMAGMSGTELLANLKIIDRHIEVLMLTAYETVETAKQALRHGACDYLTKPFDLGVIRQSVDTAMQRRSLTDSLRANSQQLQETMDELRHQQRTQSEIYASVMHDICGPLSSISMIVEMVKMDLESAHGSVPAPMLNRLAQANQQAARCIEISRRYLRGSRAQSAQPSTVLVNQVISDVRELVAINPLSKGHQFTATPLVQDVSVPINGTELVQILLNLVNNALQATKAPHAVSLSAEYLEAPLDLDTIVDGQTERLINRENFSGQPTLLAFRVRDDGPGIMPDVLPRVFETYFTTKDSGEGTGLGLSIVRRLVARLQGAIHVQTTPGKGASFTVYLPAGAK